MIKKVSYLNDIVEQSHRADGPLDVGIPKMPMAVGYDELSINEQESVDAFNEESISKLKGYSMDKHIMEQI